MGYYLVAIGEDEDAAEAIGVNAPRIKRDIYLISSFLTALAGTFYTQYIYFIDPATAFSFNISIEAALVSIVGGIGTLWGPVIGTILLETTSTLAAELARQFDRRSAADRVQPDPDGRDPVAADRADGHDQRSLAAPRQPQTGASVRAAQWQTHSLYVASASVSAVCAPFRTSASP